MPRYGSQDPTRPPAAQRTNGPRYAEPPSCAEEVEVTVGSWEQVGDCDGRGMGGRGGGSGGLKHVWG